MENDFCLGSEVKKLVPSAEHCKELKNRGWKRAKCFYWYEAYTNVYALAQAEDIGIKEEATAIPAPTAEELLQAFYKLPLVKAPEVHYDPNISKWQVWWENRKTNYMEHAAPSGSIVEAAYNAYMQVKED